MQGRLVSTICSLFRQISPDVTMQKELPILIPIRLPIPFPIQARLHVE